MKIEEVNAVLTQDGLFRVKGQSAICHTNIDQLSPSNKYAHLASGTWAAVADIELLELLDPTQEEAFQQVHENFS